MARWATGLSVRFAGVDASILPGPPTSTPGDVHLDRQLPNVFRASDDLLDHRDRRDQAFVDHLVDVGLGIGGPLDGRLECAVEVLASRFVRHGVMLGAAWSAARFGPHDEDFSGITRIRRRGSGQEGGGDTSGGAGGVASDDATTPE